MKKKKKILLVLGTRPEAIKLAPLYHKLKKYNDEFETIMCVTAQHRQMVDQVLNVFEITPDIDLNLMKSGQDLFDITASTLIGLRDVIKLNTPDVILVHGDTTTTLAASLAGFYGGVSIGHVEAGLRTYNIYAPFPEEMNRQITTKIAKWHFAPTELCFQNLVNEGVSLKNISVTGNTVIDALHWAINRLNTDHEAYSSAVNFLGALLNFKWLESKYILITGHRRENFGDGLMQICNALDALARRYPYIHFVYPVHLNPNVQEPVNQKLSGLSNVHLIEPLEYQPFILLMKNSYIVLTDSGGIQEEAPSLGKPVLVMRDVTERPEAISAGMVKLVGAREIGIINEVSNLLDNEDEYLAMATGKNPYGDGNACERIVNILREI
jgi:UDP-N-acetylglucosamine 2-epimerase (non-hydrolysing)